jgi:hypothetical protein
VYGSVDLGVTVISGTEGAVYKTSTVLVKGVIFPLTPLAFIVIS